MTPIIAAFVAALSQHGIVLSDPGAIQADGAWHRAHVDGDRRGSENLSYRIFDDAKPAGFFEDHKRGVSGTFSVAATPNESPAERAARIAEFQRRQAERAKEQAAAYKRAAEQAKHDLAAATADPRQHPYLVRKGITNPGPAIRANALGELLIPVYLSAGKLSGYQRISADGDKRFQAGARFAGAYHPIGGADRSATVVCEGYATGYALARALGHPVACAMSAGNIAAVAAALREDGRTLIFAADNDTETEARTGRNPGVLACRDAAGPGEIVLIPKFDPGDAGTDWDDACRLYGDDAARIVLEQERRRLALAARAAAPAGTGGTIEATADESVGPSQIVAQAVPDALPAAVLPRIRTALDQPVEDMAVPAKYSELSVAGELARQCAESLRYVAAWGKWMTWTGQRWEADATMRAVEYGKRMCAAVSEIARIDFTSFTTETQRTATVSKYGAAATIGNVLALARSDPRIAATVHQWDGDLWAINTPAGVVDLRTGELRAPRIGDYATKITAVAPAHKADCPAWRAFLRTVTAGDAELVGFLQRLMGYALTGEVSEHVLVFLYGPGGNGKGTFLNTIGHVFGDYAMAASTDLVTERKHEAHPTELADLQGARLVTCQETEEGKRWAEARLKSLTGGDKIRARFMRQDFFEFAPQLTLVMSGNHKPGLRNVDEAIRRRLRLVPFDVAIRPEDRDTKLPEKLRAEAPAILRWCIDGCLAWQRDGLRAPARVMAATDDYLDSQDTIAEWIAERCEHAPGTSWSRTELYASYREWAGKTGEYCPPQRRFVAALESKGYTSTAGQRGAGMIQGLALRASGHW